MTSPPPPPPPEDAPSLLRQRGLTVPAGDLPFLQRTLLRQQSLLREMRASVPPDTEPAHVFRPADPGA